MSFYYPRTVKLYRRKPFIYTFLCRHLHLNPRDSNINKESWSSEQHAGNDTLLNIYREIALTRFSISTRNLESFTLHLAEQDSKFHQFRSVDQLSGINNTQRLSLHPHLYRHHPVILFSGGHQLSVKIKRYASTPDREGRTFSQMNGACVRTLESSSGSASSRSSASFILSSLEIRQTQRDDNFNR